MLEMEETRGYLKVIIFLFVVGRARGQPKERNIIGEADTTFRLAKLLTFLVNI